MSSIEKGFATNYAREVHEAFQRMGSKLRKTVRVKNNVVGAKTVFQKVGKGTAMTKARHGKVPVMNVDHDAIECELQDYYAGDWLDALDEVKINHDERSVLANAGAYALGRKADELIIAELDKNGAADGNKIDVGTTPEGLTKDKVLAAFERLGNADVADDGQRHAVVGWKQWSDLLGIEEFANADYIGPDELPWRGTQAKRWLGTLWIPHSGLSLNGAGHRLVHWYHKTAVGHAIAKDAHSDITWHGDRAANFINTMMSQGSCLIDKTGVVTIECAEA